MREFETRVYVEVCVCVCVWFGCFFHFATEWAFKIFSYMVMNLEFNSFVTEGLGGFTRKTAYINFVFAALFSSLFVNSYVSLTSIYLVGFGLNSRNADKHVNVGLQLLQLMCTVLNWGTGKWINTLFAGILSVEFVLYFVAAICSIKLAQHGTGQETPAEIVLHGVFENSFQVLVFSLLTMYEVVSLLYVDTFTGKPGILAISSFMLSFPDVLRPVFTLVTFLVGLSVHLSLVQRCF